jgi:hypothetical protein
MRDGLYVAAQHPEGADPSQYLGEHLEQVGFVRDNGFDSVFAGPHFLSDPFQMLQLTPLLARQAAGPRGGERCLAAYLPYAVR